MARSLLELVRERARDPERARGLILAGRVLVNGRRETRAGLSVEADASIEIREPRPYPSRAAYKLLGALEDFTAHGEETSSTKSDDPHGDSPPASGSSAPGPSDSAAPWTGRVCLDLGAAHGGFTSVLLEFGARRVYAVDVAYGMLAYELRRDERVVVLERRNARHLEAEWFRSEDLGFEAGWFFTCDLSFISLGAILPALAKLAERLAARAPDSESARPYPFDGFVLIKPQFEDSTAAEGGVVRDPEVRRALVENVGKTAREFGFEVVGAREARIKGSKGNQEYVAWLRWRPGS